MAKHPIFWFIQQALVCVTSILNTESDTRVRQAALTVIKLMLKCLSLDTMKVCIHNISHFPTVV